MYKRQPLLVVCFSCQRGGESQAAGLPGETVPEVSVMTVRSTQAVSYTHLDVYKRQGLHAGCEKHPGPVPGEDERSGFADY